MPRENTFGLNDIHDVQPFMETDMACLNEIREVLSKHKAQERFGVTLLHSHFDMREDETLVEDVDVVSRTLTISVINKSEVPANAIHTNWRFDTHAPSAPVCRISMTYCD